jgi:TPR repeat protein
LLRQLDQECRAKKPASCVNLAYAVTSRELTFGPMRLSAELLRQACNEGYELGCGRLGVYLVRGWGVYQDAEKGRELLEHACKAGTWDACGWLGTELAWGHDLMADAERGLRLMEDACSHDVWHACAILSRTVRRRTEYAAKTRTAAKHACAAGSLEACELGVDYAGHEYLPGGGQPFDILDEDYKSTMRCNVEIAPGCAKEEPAKPEPAKKPAPRVEPAAEDRPESLAETERYCFPVRLFIWRGFAMEHCRRAADAHRSGREAPRNPGRALELYRRGCWGAGRFPDDASCVAFGDMLMNGEGVRSEPARAIAAWSSACWGGAKQSCDRLLERFQLTRAPDDSEWFRNRRKGLESRQ